jgi:chromosomal replication initiator protein
MNDLWESTLLRLQRTISPEAFESWIADIEFGGLLDGQLTLRVPNSFQLEWVHNNYESLVLELCQEEARYTSHAAPTSIVLTIDANLQARATAARSTEPARAPSQRAPLSSIQGGRLQTPPNGLLASRPSFAPHATFAPQSTLPQPPPVADLNPMYSFDNFVVGPSNQLAHAASVAVASSPGTRYNPLFIYGGVGLGKTHLVNAIGHTVLANNPGASILYLSAERFTNEFIWSLQNHRIAQFRERYRSHCDVLLMDDIQFLAGREQTQEEFFHTFNALHHANKQIVVTSDVYPQQIPEMEERLISRFQSGMVADVQAPEVDTRVAILRTKAAGEGIQLSQEVAHYLAQVVKSNVRELEGTLTRLAVLAELRQRPIDMDLAREATRTVMPQLEQITSVEDIQRAVCEYFGVRMADLKGKKRTRSVSHPRMIAMYLCRERLGTSYPDLGSRFGGKDHTTVLSAYKKIGRLLEENDDKVLDAITAVDRKLGL